MEVPSLAKEKEWTSWFSSFRGEESYEIEEKEGEIPAGLTGTWFRNGPGLLETPPPQLSSPSSPSSSPSHVVDADGMIAKITIHHQKAYFQNKHVRTKGFLLEQKKGKRVFRGAFGSYRLQGENIFDTLQKNYLNLSFKNTANTSVIEWGGKLLCLYEAGLPYCVDPTTLNTFGEDRMNETLAQNGAFSAHPKVDAKRRHLINFGIDVMHQLISIWEFNENSDLIIEHKIKARSKVFVIHDFAITENYYIIATSPINLSLLQLATGSTVEQCCHFDSSRPSLIYVVERFPKNRNGVNAKYKLYSANPMHFVHHANAYETSDGKSIIFDSLPFPKPNSLDIPTSSFTNPHSSMKRFRIDLTKPDLTKLPEPEILCEIPIDMPRIRDGLDGYPHRYVYGADLRWSPKPNQKHPWSALVKVDVEKKTFEIWQPQPLGLVSEAIFVIDPARQEQEDGGWLLSMIYDPVKTSKSYLAILDAQNLAAGPVAKLHLKSHMPFSFHSNFSDQIFLKRPNPLLSRL